MERVKRAISDLVHLRGTKGRTKKHRQGDLESQPLRISGPIIESQASSVLRPFGHSLLIPGHEREYNAAVGTTELAPANDNASPFRPIHPLQMCAPLVRSHAHSTILHGSKNKQTFASPRTPNPGVLTPNSRHSLSRVLDHVLVRGEFSHFIFVFLIRFHVQQHGWLLWHLASSKYLISLLPRLVMRSTASWPSIEGLLGRLSRSFNGLPIDIILLAAAFLVCLPSAIKVREEWELACKKLQPMNDLFDDVYDAQETPGRSTRPEDNQIRPITCIPTSFRPPSALPARSSELLILASIAIAAQNTTPVASPEPKGSRFGLCRLVKRDGRKKSSWSRTRFWDAWSSSQTERLSRQIWKTGPRSCSGIVPRRMAALLLSEQNERDAAAVATGVSFMVNHFQAGSCFFLTNKMRRWQTDPDGDKVPLIASEMIIYIRPRAHKSNELSCLLEAFSGSQFKGHGVWGYSRLDSSFSLHSYFSDAAKSRDGRPLVKSIYIMLLSFSMHPHGKTSPVMPSPPCWCASVLALGFVTTRVLLFYFRQLPATWHSSSDGYLTSSSPARDRSKEFSLRFRGQVYIMRESRKD